MSNREKPQIAYLGMGIMGSSMAVNLVKGGYAVRVWNRTANRPGILRAAESGASAFENLADAVASADIIMMCLSDVPDLESILLGSSGVLDHGKKGAIVVDFSTTGPECAMRMHKSLAEKGLRFLDAPVSGGDLGARNATLSIMVGGDVEDYQQCLPTFQSIGKNIYHCGPSGSGQAVKLCNQILCAVNMLSVCEALKMADALGVERKLMIDVCGSGAAGSWALSNLAPRIANGDFEPGFMIKDMLKDLRLAFESLEAQHSKAAVGELSASKLAVEKFRQAELIIGSTGSRKGTQAMFAAYNHKP